MHHWLINEVQMNLFDSVHLEIHFKFASFTVYDMIK